MRPAPIGIIHDERESYRIWILGHWHSGTQMECPVGVCCGITQAVSISNCSVLILNSHVGLSTTELVCNHAGEIDSFTRFRLRITDYECIFATWSGSCGYLMRRMSEDKNDQCYEDGTAPQALSLIRRWKDYICVKPPDFIFCATARLASGLRFANFAD